MPSLAVFRVGREGGALPWRRFSVGAGLGLWCWRDVDGEWFLERMLGSVRKCHADPLGGKQYWYKSEATVPKRGDCAALAAGEDSAAESPYVWAQKLVEKGKCAD